MRAILPAFFAALGLVRRADLNPHRPAGTPARPSKNILEGKTRGERKREARTGVIENWTGEARLHHHWPSHARRVLEGLTEPDTKPGDVYLEQARKLCPDQAKSMEDVPPLVVEQMPDGFYVFETQDGKRHGFSLAGPYKDKKTANRRMRQLGG